MLGAVTVANHGLSKELTMSSFFFFPCVYFLWGFLFIYLFLTALGLCFWNWKTNMRVSLVAASEGYSSLQCTGFSLWSLLLLQSPVFRLVGSVIVAHD